MEENNEISDQGKLGLTSDQANFYDLIIKFLGVLGGVIVFSVGICQYKITSEREFKKEFYIEQISVMKKCVDIVSTIASYPVKSEEYEKAEFELEKLRVGALNLFADDSLKEKMGLFWADYNIYTNPDTSIVIQGVMKSHSSDISSYCRKKILNLTELDSKE